MKYLLTSHGRWRAPLFGIDARQRYAATLALVACLLGCWYVFVYARFNRSIRACERTRDALCKLCDTCEASHNASKERERALQAMEATVRLHERGELSVNESVFQLLADARNAAMTIESCTIEPTVDNGWLRTNSVALAIVGTPAKVAEFFVQATSKDQLCSIERVNMTEAHGDVNAMKCSVRFCYATIARV